MSIFRYSGLLKSVRGIQHAIYQAATKRIRSLIALIAFFLLGYSTFVVTVFLEIDVSYDLIIVPILFFGACFVLATADITVRIFRELLSANVQLEKMALKDVLTQLPNRRQLESRLNIAIDDAKQSGSIVGLMMLDIDRFKRVNDSYGHRFGDELLVAASGKIIRSIRESAFVARFGGDEFAVIIDDAKSFDEVVEEARNAIRAFTKPVVVRDQEIRLGLTVGVSFCPRDGASVDELIKNADLAMYNAKDRGKNTCAVFSGEMVGAAQQKLQLESELREALVHNEFVLHFQPQMDISREKAFGVEALVRWQKKDGRLCPPMEFIPLAEETGLIVQMDLWALKQACRTGADWHARGMQVRMSVNASAMLLGRENIVKQVLQTLEETSFPASYLTMEITETALLQNIDSAVEVIRQLKNKGVEFSLDDFGTGYSSLSYLRMLPIRALKIDRSFIKDLSVSGQGAETLVQSIIGLAGSLGIGVVAEGVETEEQRDFLKRHGCYRIQGYLYSPPLCQQDAEEWLGNHMDKTLHS
ncbi:EAL domain-containing protein [Desulfovibrio mangrovi]|uniref:putative bifunctional diguanylate cyclase/phosphodiesterase n=1 Tax=Desulfovibrio mangrovi TaxID=2976983 RepID=UPI0022471191|nr:EAL domain-containing protein [Desulfovibrio mangrovi]UZP66690.1 EAL domain-containing protein [Desulfovibrio mangrovi]